MALGVPKASCTLLLRDAHLSFPRAAEASPLRCPFPSRHASCVPPWGAAGAGLGHIPEGCWVLMEFGEAVQALLMAGGCSPVSPGVYSRPFASSNLGASSSA